MGNKTFSRWLFPPGLYPGPALCWGLAAASLLVGLCGCQRSGAPAPVEWGYKQAPTYPVYSTYAVAQSQPLAHPESRQKREEKPEKKPEKGGRADDIQILDIQNGTEEVILSQKVSKAPGETVIRAEDLEIIELNEGDENKGDERLLESSLKKRHQRVNSLECVEQTSSDVSDSGKMLDIPRPCEKPIRGVIVPMPLPQKKRQSTKTPMASRVPDGKLPVPSHKPVWTRLQKKKAFSPEKPERKKMFLSQSPHKRSPATVEKNKDEGGKESLFLADPVSEAPPYLLKATPEKPAVSASQGSSNSASQGSSKPTQGTSKSISVSSAPFSWPLRGKILKGFSKSGADKRNDGLNIEGALGESVRAARQGQVVYVGNELHGFGHLILVKHDDEWMSAYAHLSKVHAQRGDHVKRGQVIGAVGSSGSVYHPQLHFEVRQYSQPVDPRRFLE